jgi:hypothetical protein
MRSTGWKVPGEMGQKYRKSEILEQIGGAFNLFQVSAEVRTLF